MNPADFRTLGECDFGTIWYVEGEDRVVINAYQAAMYFTVEDFHQFAHMVESAMGRLTGAAPRAKGKRSASGSSKIRALRTVKSEEDE